MLTKEQQLAVQKLYVRFEYRRKPSQGTSSYLAFRRRVKIYPSLGCAGIELWGMFIGIETDGYTHT